MEHKIGDILFSLKNFMLEDIHQRPCYYGLGDEFIVMNIYKQGNYTYYELNSKDSCFKWIVDKEEGFEEFIGTKKRYQRKVREMKIRKIYGI